MADVELVIKISEEEYEYCKTWELMSPIAKAIVNGTQLPKGHGDLVDRDEINDRFYGIWRELKSYSNKPSQKELLDKWSMCMDDAPTIIEANEEEDQ